MKIDIALLPQETKEKDLSNTVCIVLDIFRATTSIVTSMSNGCNMMVPTLSFEDAQEAAAELGPVLFAGERKSIRIEGCSLGNSPFEFSKDVVQGKTIVMTTTNGTVAIKSTEGAYCTLIGSFLNANAVCQQAVQYGKDILIVCAGTDGLFSLEDSLCAGLLVQILSERCGMVLTDSAYGAMLMYAAGQVALAETAIASRNGQRLRELDLVHDVEYCIKIDTVTLVPQYSNGKIMIEN